MLYRFKSKASGDVVMLQPNGKQLLEILGKDPAGPGIILPEQIPDAIKVLQDAVFEEEAELQREIQEALARDDDTPIRTASRCACGSRPSSTCSSTACASAPRSSS